jgi:hypothetical protein
MTIRNLMLAALLLPVSVLAADDLGGDSPWFVHVNLAAMRDASDGGALYGWVEREIIDDLEDEFGEGRVSGIEQVSVFGTRDGEGLGILMTGRMDAETRGDIVRRFAAEPLEGAADGAFEVGADADLADEIDIELDEGSLFLGFGEDGDLFVTSRRALLDQFQSGGRFAPVDSTELLVVRAESLVSGGFDAESLANGPIQWDSKVMRNIRRGGFALSDVDGGYGVSLELVAVDEPQAQALLNIMQGLIGLQALADEEPKLGFLDTARTERDAERVSVSVQVSSEQLMHLLD